MRRICRNLFLLTLLTGCAGTRKPMTAHHAFDSDFAGRSVASTSLTAEAAEAGEQDSSTRTATATGREPPNTATMVSKSTSRQDSNSPRDSEPVDDQAESAEVRLASLQNSTEEARKNSADAADSDVPPTEDSSLLTDPIRNTDSAAPPDAANAKAGAIQYGDVVGSVYQSYPLLQSALLGRNIALGQQIGASGAFDTKLKAASENGPQGFYETYRQSVGVVQPTYWGGEVFAGYRVGRGSFQPWYQERQTNDGGEFKAGVLLPLARGREIDPRRAELWKAGLGRNLAEPDIQAQLIDYVQEASYGYWDWVAAGEYHRIALRILLLAEERTGRIEAQVKAGLIDPPELTDNLRLVSIRQAKSADTRRKLQQTAAKLSVYYRDAQGEPLLPLDSQLPGFPEPDPVKEDQLSSDIQLAMRQRPELRMLDIMRQQTQIDYSEARNQLQPELNALLIGSQDVGEPTSSKRDKSPYEGEASLYFDVPMQRRKAQGKMTELQAKLAQLAAKRRITADKISVDVQMAHAALKSAWEQVEQTREALGYAEDLAAIERTNQEKGFSDLLKVTLREQYAVESAEKNVEALRLYFESQADFRAAMAQDQINR